MMPTYFRVGRALLIAPIVPALYIGIGSPIVARLPVLSGIGLLPIGYLFGLLFEIVLGVPVFLVGRHFDLIRWWSAVISGFTIGLIAAVVIQLPHFHWPLNLYTRSGDLLFGLVVAVTGLVSWTAGTIERPSLDRF